MSQAPLVRPDAGALLAVASRLAGEIYLEMSEKDLADLFISSLSKAFPDRGFAIRVFDPRSMDRASAYSNWELRPGVDAERVRIKASSIQKTRLKSAIAASARIIVDRRWDSPFPAVAAGFAVPLVAAGELYGVLDVGYRLGSDVAEFDEPLILPFANQLSVNLRNERLHRETSVLRDYQAKLIEHANALILGVDRHWRIVVCNQALLHLTGFDRDAVIGRDLRDWLSPEQRPRLQKLFLQALSGHQADTVEVELVTATGGQVRTVWSVATISGKQNEVEAVVAIGQDQTRLQELQSQVIQAEKLATLGQLAAGVVHELNNPLTSITVYAEYLLRKSEIAVRDQEPVIPEPADVEKLRRIAGGAQRILQFARDLVQYAAPAGDELDMISINTVVEQSLSFCEHLFDRSGIELELELQRALPAIHAVPGQLEQVVINLVTNAVQAIERDGCVRVTTYREGDEVCFAVADDGPGIAPREVERIFEPFYTTKTNGQGTGLGLSIVTNIVEQHRGNIAVSSPPEGGVTFTVSLPTAV